MTHQTLTLLHFFGRVSYVLYTCHGEHIRVCHGIDEISGRVKSIYLAAMGYEQRECDWYNVSFETSILLAFHVVHCTVSTWSSIVHRIQCTDSY